MTTDKPAIPQPTDPPTRATLSILAQWFEERRDARKKLADEYRDEPSHDAAEQDVIASAFDSCAIITWELAGGRPEATPREHERFIKVSTADLAKLLALTEQIQKHSESDDEFAETNRVLSQSAQRIKDLTKERDQAKSKIAELEKRLATERMDVLQRAWDAIKSAGPVNRRIIGANNFVDNLYTGTDIARAFKDELAKAEHTTSSVAQTATQSLPHLQRILLGITFQRELPDGSRETLDPSAVRLVVGDDPTRLVPVALKGQTS